MATYGALLKIKLKFTRDGAAWRFELGDRTWAFPVDGLRSHQQLERSRERLNKSFDDFKSSIHGAIKESGDIAWEEVDRSSKRFFGQSKRFLFPLFEDRIHKVQRILREAWPFWAATGRLIQGGVFPPMAEFCTDADNAIPFEILPLFDVKCLGST